MKKLYILTLAAAMLITTSCDDFLATDTPPNKVTQMCSIPRLWPRLP